MGRIRAWSFVFAGVRRYGRMGRTSLQIIAWTYAVRREAPGQRPPDVQVFDKTITDQELVHDIQQQFDGLQRGVRGGSILAQPTYRYEFRFATNGVTAQVYAGSPNHVPWQVTTLGEHPRTDTVAGPPSKSLYGMNLLTALHVRTEMPLPGW